jgi:hypothetical protein
MKLEVRRTSLVQNTHERLQIYGGVENSLVGHARDVSPQTSSMFAYLTVPLTKSVELSTAREATSCVAAR